MRENHISKAWKEILVGQDHVIERVTPYIIRAQAGLTMPNRPVAIFFLLGPSGVGKTKTVESLAEILHGSDKSLIRVDCAEFQMEHEVAKVIGAPPGYLGHRETVPIFNPKKLADVVSSKCDMPIILLDEIEKAHASLHRVLLGIMDKASLRLGDNSSVSFEKAIIFMTSNLAAKEIGELFTNSFGFGASSLKPAQDKQIEKLGLGAMNKKFPPEFPNRIDEIITFRPLDSSDLLTITALEFRKMQVHIASCMGPRSFQVNCDQETLEFLTRIGTSQKYGAREIKRTINRHIMNPLADDIVEGKILPGSQVDLYVVDDRIEWDIKPPLVTIESDGSISVPVSAPEPKRYRKQRAS